EDRQCRSSTLVCEPAVGAHARNVFSEAHLVSGQPAHAIESDVFHLPELPEREIGRVVGELPGPTLIAIAGIHGNEPGGITAARRVLATLSRRKDIVRGEMVAFAGNLGALRQGRRYRLRDMNRV